MQARPPPAAGQAGPSRIAYQQPIPPSISPSIGNLIPRLRTAINDIDIFQNMVAQGAIDNSMPNWDALLRQYTLLVGRLNNLSNHLTSVHSSHQPTPSQPNGSSTKPTARRVVPLDQQILTPLNPIPPTVQHGTDIFFQALNTVPLQDVHDHQTSLLAREGWKTEEELRGMSDEALQGFMEEMRGRAKDEANLAGLLGQMVDEQGETYEWDKRVDVEQDEDDLFAEPEEKKEEEEPALPNIRAGWTLSDYVRYMDTGARPS